jgi:excisionase family DNA binding protein
MLDTHDDVARLRSCGGDLVTGRLMTAVEVADWLQVTPEWVHEMARDGGIPSMKLGRYWRFERAAVADWLVERQQRIVTRRTGGG